MRKFLLAIMFVSLFCSIADAVPINELVIQGGPAYHTYKWFDSGSGSGTAGQESDEYVFLIDKSRPGEIVKESGEIEYLVDYQAANDCPNGVGCTYDYFYVEFISGPYSGAEIADENYFFGGIDPYSADVTQFKSSTSYGYVIGFGHYKGNNIHLFEHIGDECIDAGWFYLAETNPVPEPAILILISSGVLVFGPKRKLFRRFFKKNDLYQ